MNRVEAVRARVDDILRGQPNLQQRRCGFVHLYGVAQAAALLALRRGLDVELATLAGMLHDVVTYRDGDLRDHAARSALEARAILASVDGLGEAEIALICGAIARHSDKMTIDGPLDELLKDADVLQRYLYNPTLRDQQTDDAWRARLAQVLGQLGTHAP